MNAPILFALPCCENKLEGLAAALNADVGEVILRRFPDQETYLRILNPVKDRDVVILASLDRPDNKILPLLFLARSLREQGASTVSLVAPYLAYMRQDRVFSPGEDVSSRYFAEVVSNYFDWMVTVDPHLHRYQSLLEIYTIPTEIVHAAPAIASWVATKIENPIFIGPDEESGQWVRAVAELANAPSTVLQKTRHGDRDVGVSVPNLEDFRDRTPVLVDDIVSTARTMIETVGHLRWLGLNPPICIGVHAIFAGNAYDELCESGVAKVVSCNTVAHGSNDIDVTWMVAEAITKLLSLEVES